jgi:SAM-dependent methyltransferase
MQEHNLINVLQVWESLAKTDPLWAILSVDQKKGNRWDIEEFFEQGKHEIEGVITQLREFAPPMETKSALDFGCGVGRLSQFLADYYDCVVGVDISPTMLELARRLNRHGNRVEYIQNTVDNLHIFTDAHFDLVYSNLVLQHMDPVNAANYLKEFFRITKKGGYVVFQIPSHLTEDYLPSDSNDMPLPVAVCKAALVLKNAPETVAAGAEFAVQLDVTNLSNQDWLQCRTRPLNVGNHWLLEDECTVLVNDDGRSRLPGRLPAGAQSTVLLRVTAPQVPGNYFLAIDVVQEGVRWFADVGSVRAHVPIRVSASPASAEQSMTQVLFPIQAPASDGKELSFTMDGIPKDDILRLISEFDSELLTTEEDITEWYSYKYYVRR